MLPILLFTHLSLGYFDKIGKMLPKKGLSTPGEASGVRFRQDTAGNG